MNTKDLIKRLQTVYDESTLGDIPVFIAELREEEDAKERLQYLRGEILNECISYGEIAELVSLAKYIDEDDVLLLEWAGVPEKHV